MWSPLRLMRKVLTIFRRNRQRLCWTAKRKTTRIVKTFLNRKILKTQIVKRTPQCKENVSKRKIKHIFYIWIHFGYTEFSGTLYDKSRFQDFTIH